MVLNGEWEKPVESEALHGLFIFIFSGIVLHNRLMTVGLVL